MQPPTPTSRSRAAWEGLAGVPVTFSPAVPVAVSPASRLCPSGWVGLVVVGDAGIATAPTPQAAQTVQQALGAQALASGIDAGLLSAGLLSAGLLRAGLLSAGLLRTRLPVAEMLGPAILAYLDPGEFRSQQREAVIEPIHPRARDLRQFLAVTGSGDLEESGIGKITSPAFVLREQGQIAAVAG
jgi:hypothetical protein